MRFSNHSFSIIGDKNSFTFCSSKSLRGCSFLQSLQSLFQSLWDITIFIADASRNGSTHIFMSLCTVQAAELVWIVDKTKCHVNAASTASVAVSLSLISHTIIISGSCLTRLLKPEEKVYQISGFT